MGSTSLDRFHCLVGALCVGALMGHVYEMVPLINHVSDDAKPACLALNPTAVTAGSASLLMGHVP